MLDYFDQGKLKASTKNKNIRFCKDTFFNPCSPKLSLMIFQIKPHQSYRRDVCFSKASWLIKKSQSIQRKYNKGNTSPIVDTAKAKTH